MSGPSPAPTPNRSARLPFLLLGLTTVVSFGGPFLIALLLWGGPRSGWPPDRPVEWIGFGVVMTLFAACFLACVTIGWWRPRGAGGPGRDQE